MTPKERVKVALAHREPDRVPVGEFATDHSVIAEALGRPTFWRAKRRYHEALWDGRRDEVVEGMKRDIVEFTLKHCAPGGGLILSSSHSIVVRTPLANYRAMVEAARQRGAYPIRIPERVPQPAWGAA